MDIHNNSKSGDNNNTRELDFHKDLFLKKFMQVVKKLPAKPRLLMKPLKKAILKQFDGCWDTHFNYLHMMINHLETLNTTFHFLLTLYIHSALYLVIVNRDGFTNYVASWETLSAELLNYLDPLQVTGKYAKIIHKEILDYLQSFVQILVDEDTDQVSKNLRLGKLIDRTLHCLYNLQENREPGLKEKEFSIHNIILAIEESNLSLLEKNNLIRICKLIHRSGNPKKLDRVRKSVLQLVTLKSAKRGSSSTRKKRQWNKVKFNKNSEEQVLKEIENMLISCMREETICKNKIVNA